ncbi:hypothetical protein [Blastococcus sp. SYSU DS0617]
MPDSPSTDHRAGQKAFPGLRQRAMMLLPVVLPLMIYALVRIGDSSRAGLAIAGALLAAVAVGTLLVARRRGTEELDG